MTAKQYAFRDAVKTCEECARPISLTNSRDLVRKRFCSPKCKAASQFGQRPQVPPFSEARKCVKCGIDYIARVQKQTFCSQRCSNRVMAQREVKRNVDLSSHIKRLLVYGGRKAITATFLLDLYRRQGGRCALTGVPMTWDREKGRVKTNLSIDRIQSWRGYEEGNVQLTCRLVNLMKHNLTGAEFVDLCRLVVQNADPQRRAEISLPEV
jgi:hypothetical protein